MSFFGFNRTAKHRKFDFIPRYYDADKEELEDRLSKYDGKEIDQTELAKRRIQSGLRTKYRLDSNYKSAQKKKSTRTLIYIIGILSFICYLVLSSNKFLKLIEGI